MSQERRRKYPNLPPVKRNELLCEQNRLSICINSLRRLAKRGRGYDIIIMDEFATTSLSIFSKHMLPYITETMNILETLMKKSSVIVLLAADGKPAMAKMLLPFIDWDDPVDLHITINNGGEGGIIGHELYVSDDLNEVCRVLKKYIQEGKSVYVPTNRRRFAESLKELCEDRLGLKDDEIIVYDKFSPNKLKEDMIDKDPKKRLGYTVNSPHTKVRVFIATPAFGVGFSIPGGIFDITIAFFYTDPLTVSGNVQHLARVRGVKENTIICYYESPLSNQMTFSPRMRNEQTHLENAIMSYEDRLISVDCTNFNRIPEDRLRSFAIACEVQDRLSTWYAVDMFISDVTKGTQVEEAHCLRSWLCGCGVGPIIKLPVLSDAESRIIRSKNGKYIITTDPPTTWEAMYDLSLRLSLGHDLTRDEVEFGTLFEELPIPYGLLNDKERKKTIVNNLDRILHVIEVLTSGDKSTLLKMDYKRYTRSQAISTISREQRYYQQYQLYDAWSHLVTPYIVQRNQTSFNIDHGIDLFSFMINRGRSDSVEDAFSFDLKPNVDDVYDLVEQVEELLDDLHKNDAREDEWFNKDSLDALKNEPEDGLSKIYAKIVSKGFKRLLGRSNVSVTTRKKNGVVRVKITGLKRLISLACVRRISLGCDIVFLFNVDKFSIISKFREHSGLSDMIPSEFELGCICGMENVV